MTKKVSTDRNKSLIITLFLMLLLMLLFLLPVFTIVHPTPTEKELQMVDLSAGFSVNNETGGGSKPKQITKPTPTPPKQKPITETPVENITPPKNIETQQTESPIETTPPKPVETTTPDPEPEKTTPLYSFEDTDTDNSTTETSNQNTRTTSGGRAIGNGEGDGSGEGENGFGGIGLGGALSGRKIINPSSPRANCPLNKTEVVVLNVRVNSEGTVIFAEPNYTKSLTSNKCLLDFSVDYAKKLKWNKSNIRIQSGTIQFTFKP